MKRFVMLTLILVTFVSALTVLWADKRTRNVNQYFGKCASEETDGPLSADAYITSDVDYPGEGDGFVDKAKSRLETLLEGYGVEYEAYAHFKGEAPNDDYEGTYEAYAGAPGDLTGDYLQRTDWDEEIEDEVSTNGEKTKLHNNDKKWSDAEKERYDSWDDIQAATDLSACTAWADIDGSSPAIPGRWVVKKGTGRAYGEKVVIWMEWEKGREALSHYAYGNAWNFPDPTQHNAEHDAEQN